MANKNAAKKDIRQTKKRTALNNVKRRAYKDAMKAARTAIAAGDDKAQELVLAANKLIDKAAKGNVLHANRAGRLKSRLQKSLNKAGK